MRTSMMLRNERGVALVIVILVSLAVAAIALGAAMMSSNTHAIDLFDARVGELGSAAQQGMEIARSRVNGDKSLYPDSLYVTLESHVTATDAAGKVIPNIYRTTYIGPTGVTSGQYGVYGSVVTLVQDNLGNSLIRRNEIYQESFARFAYFTDSEGGNIYFGGGDQIFGPVHSNDQIKIHTTGATFHSDVKTAKNVFQPQYGTFKQGYEEYVPKIPMPTTADLNKLKTQAQSGNTAIVGNTTGNAGQATTRLWFVAIDMNGDGDVTDDNEGFMRVYQAPANAAWVTGDVPSDYGAQYLRNAENCGDYHGTTFTSFKAHGTSGAHQWTNAVVDPSRRCYLGGADSINNGFLANDGKGQWIKYPGTVAAQVLAKRPADAAYLFPINRAFNPSFKGVIHVTGNVVISGIVRGQITIAATGDIVLGDDLKYATDPGAGTCADMVGMFAGGDVIVADNTVNAPVIPAKNGAYKSYDDTQGEFIQGVVLTLKTFTVENYDKGATVEEPCEGTKVGRGCLYLTGGIIQETRGAVGLTDGHGYIKRYAYDQCAATVPPPYFPTTGHFARGRVFEVNPVGFNVDQYYSMLTPKK